MKKYIVITSIFPPTESVKRFAKIADWKVIVVGDKKTPKNWNLKNVIYLSPREQLKLFPAFASNLPWNSYTRKNVGYLYAINQGADIIADADDDCIPYNNWGNNLIFSGKFKTINSDSFVNIYKYFSDKFIWPRGYPLDKILDRSKIKTKLKKQEIGVYQFLVDSEPDVDAIYRLTLNKKNFFDKKPPVVLEKNTICPFNTQNTFFIRELFPLLFLPPFTSFRFVDILRGLVAQPLMWLQDFHLAFGGPTVIQKRHYHNFLNDFELEIPVYLYSEKVSIIAVKAIHPRQTILKNMLNVYSALSNQKIIDHQVINSLKMWIKEINL